VRLAFATPEAASGVAIKDPCDLLIQRGPAAFEAQLADAVGWFEFLMAGVAPLAERERLQAADRVLELIRRLAKPLARDAKLIEMAERLGYSASAVREQFQSLPARLRERAQQRRDVAQPGSAGGGARRQPPAGASRREKLLERAWRDLLGAVLRDADLSRALDSLCAAGEHVCPDPQLAQLADQLVAIGRRESRLPDLDGLMAVCEHPARDLIVPLMQEAEGAESPGALFEGARTLLERVRSEDLRCARVAQIKRLALESPIEHAQELAALHRDLRRELVAPAHPEHGAPARS